MAMSLPIAFVAVLYFAEARTEARESAELSGVGIIPLREITDTGFMARATVAKDPSGLHSVGDDCLFRLGYTEGDLEVLGQAVDPEYRYLVRLPPMWGASDCQGHSEILVSLPDLHRLKELSDKAPKEREQRLRALREAEEAAEQERSRRRPQIEKEIASVRLADQTKQ